MIANHLQSEREIKISLAERLAIPPVSQATSDTGNETLKVAIAGVLSPVETLASYQQLFSYMERELGKDIVMIQKPTYAEINDLVRSQHIRLAFVCSGAYVEGHRDFGMELLVVPQVQGETMYYSYLIVPSSSDAQSLADLRGTFFAFTDPLSNSGHLAPAYQLHLLGETPESFFSGYVFTYNHDNSIMAVAANMVDGAAVDSLVYDRIVARDPELASKTKIIARWGPYGIPPVVVSPGLDTKLKSDIQELFLSLDGNPEGKSVLGQLGIDRFVLVRDELYDSIREMVLALGW